MDFCAGKGMGGCVAKFCVVAAAMSVPVALARAQEGGGFVLPDIEVVAVTPLLGAGISADRAPVNVRTLRPGDDALRHPLDLGELLNQSLGSVTVNDVQNNPYQKDIQLRGYTASPLLGTPQGLAVYQNGVRVNESFGDVVQWDTIPEFAIDSLQVVPGANPAFGLNALGGALALRMKDGFTARGASLAARGGFFGTAETVAEYAYADPGGAWAAYSGFSFFREDGWRDFSGSEVFQLYSDARWRGERFEVAATSTFTMSELVGNGPVPVQLLAQRRRAIFTHPDITDNDTASLSVEGSYDMAPGWSLSGNAYYRHRRRDTVNGDAFEAEACEDDNAFLCSEDDESLVDRSGARVREGDSEADAALNRTLTLTNAFGVAMQAVYEADIGGFANYLALGASVDGGRVRYGAETELGSLTPSRGVDGAGVVLGGAAAVALRARNTYIGLYVHDVWTPHEDVDVTFSGRWNLARITLNDRLGDSLNGSHRFQRFNPSVGVVWRPPVGVEALQAYAQYGEANRIPTAAELSCADPEESCRVPNAFLADPPLRQVVNRSLEAGLRGSLPVSGLSEPLLWSVGGFGGVNRDDIIFVAGDLMGTGYFRNAGRTRRLGMEFSLSGAYAALRWSVQYSYVEASFRSRLALPGANHPNQAEEAVCAALEAESACILVEPGDSIPGIPAHNARVNLTYAPDSAWEVGVGLLVAGGQYLRGDESNDLGKTDAYAVVNLSGRYRVGEGIEAFFSVVNLFDTEYETFGLVGEPDEVLGEDFDDPRFLGPGAPLTLFGGVRAVF